MGLVMTENPLRGLAALGQSVWYDNIHRGMLPQGLQERVDRDALCGVTTNPAIFQKAIGGTSEYDQAIQEAVAAVGTDPSGVYEQLAMEDIRIAADVLRPVFDRSAGVDGYVSMEVEPGLAHDARGTVTEALRLHADVARANVMIKVPATPAGVEAFEELIVRGIPVNVTLLFSVERYYEIAQAYVRALERRRQAGEPVSEPASVASLFVSRLDAKVDAWLQQEAPQAFEEWGGRAAIANARAAYGLYQDVFHGDQFASLAAAGARPQRLLWASTGVKGDRYPQTYYVEALAGPETVTTLPPATYDAYLHSGQPARRLEEGVSGAVDELHALADLGVDFQAFMEELEREGIEAFVEAHNSLLGALREKLKGAAPA